MFQVWFGLLQSKDSGILMSDEQARPFHVGAIAAQTMTLLEFNRLAELITSELGIKLPPVKRTMLQARLQKRLRVLGLTSYAAYCDYLFESGALERERPYLYDVVTTNTTYFFREPKHFSLLMQEVLPALLFDEQRRKLRVWSAGCSTGEEAYTLAMLLMDFCQRHQSYTFKVLGTDISTQVLRYAVRAIYSKQKADGIPRHLLTQFFMRSKDRNKEEVKIVPELRDKVEFRRLNFMEEFSFQQSMDIIFCRNVIIYFDRRTQEELLHKLCHQLRPGGYFFSGHSESISGMNLPLETVAPTVYRKL